MKSPRDFLVLFFLFFLIPHSLFCAAIKTTVQIDPHQTSDAQRIEGSIQIIHEPSVKIDLNSFQLDGKPLAVTLQQSEPYIENGNDKAVGGPTLVSSHYRFSIPSQSAGLHLLSAISFKADNQSVQTAPTSYEIFHEEARGPLILRSAVKGTLPLYPGQRTELVYEILFKGTIDLSREILPLIDAKGMKKIGSVHVDESTSGEYDVQVITQKVQAEQPGSYTYGPSMIEGTLYQYIPGQGNLSATRVSARAPSIVVDVKPFPEKNQPPSFNGAVGSFSYNLELLSPSVLNVGDVIKLRLKVSGEGELDTVSLPNLYCQPGFSGFFSHGELPPGEKNEKGGKTFLIELRPLSSMVQSIPSIEFSFFDPNIQDYQVTHSQSIPLTVTVLKTEVQEKAKAEKQKERVEDDKDDVVMDWDQILTQYSFPDLLPDVPLKSISKWKLWASNAFVLWLVPLGFILLAIQRIMKKYVQRYLQNKRNVRS